MSYSSVMLRMGCLLVSILLCGLATAEARKVVVVQDGSGQFRTIIKNLTLIGLEVKYTIHADGGSAYVLNIENCTLRREYPSARAKKYAAGFGIGLRADQHIQMKDCLIEADLPIYWHNWNEQKSSCSMTLDRCVLKGKKSAIGLYNLGSGQKDSCVLHDCVLESEGPAIEYANLRDVKGTTWSGQSETALIGSGNKMDTVSGSAIKDDSAKRQSGLELRGQAEPDAPKP
jgi:hypothetical protein